MQAFRNCPNLKDIGDYSSLTSLSVRAFVNSPLEIEEFNAPLLSSLNGYNFSSSKIKRFIVSPLMTTYTHAQYYSKAETCEFIMQPRTDTTWRMGLYNFEGASSARLTKVVLAEGLTEFGGDGWYHQDCPIVIPLSCTTIANRAFGREAGENASLYFKSTTPPTIYDQTFHYWKKPIHIPLGTLQTYSNASVWSNYASRLVEYDFNLDPDNINQYCV
jgi:hypothetical protein